MKYPIDSVTTETFIGHLVANDRAQRQLIQALTILLTEAMNEMGMEDTEWYPEAEALLNLQKKLKNEHETRLFNEKNGHVVVQDVAVSSKPDVSGEVIYIPGISGLGQIEDPQLNANINEREKAFGEELSEAEIRQMFHDKSEKRTKKSVNMTAKDPFKDMTLEEIEEWERTQDNSNDIYKVKARVANLARGSGGSLTAVGEMMVNSFVHVVKDLYDFAETIPDKSLKIAIIERVRKHEGMPGNLIAATSSNVRVKK